LYIEKLLKRSSLDLMWTPTRLKNGEPNKGRYGFGWFIGQRNSQLCHHDGAWQAFEAAIDRYLDDQLTVVALANLTEAKPEKITQHVPGMYLGDK
jgi:hypothetical protein